MLFHDTIVAIATAPGAGAVAILRLSGKNAIHIADAVYHSPNGNKRLIACKPNTIHFGTIRNGNEIVDEVLVSLFKAPHSYTGEDSVEVSCHGSVFIQQKLLQLFIQHGARLSRPGEFTMRAFLNGKMDLSQAEAVADLIASDSEASHKVALHQMRGGFAKDIEQLRAQLLHFIAMIELELDFAEEDVEFADRKQLTHLVVLIQTAIQKLLNSFTLGNVIKNGIPVAIVGEPNVGKSTLLNALLREERAIVSEIAGTTRDTIEDIISLDGIKFRFIDTAGLRETSDLIERMGIERTREKLMQASIVLLLIDANVSAELALEMAQQIKDDTQSSNKLLLVLNKSDLASPSQLSSLQETLSAQGFDLVSISAKNSQNLPELEKHLLQIVKYTPASLNDVIVTNTRHYEALMRTNDALIRVLDGIAAEISSDFVAQDIREALHYLGEISGTITNDDILGHIFKNFCIGK